MFTDMDEENKPTLSQIKAPPVEVEEAEDAPFHIEQLFGSRTRARLLGLFLENAHRAFYVREVARRVDAQLNAVRRELKNLLDIGVILETDGAGGIEAEEGEEVKGENKKYYQADPSFPLFEDLRSVMRKVAILMNRSLVEGLQKQGHVALVILTGRFVDSTTIPTDILIVSDCKPDTIAAAVADFERDLGREVNFTAMTQKEFLYRRDVGDRFVVGILQGKKAVLLDTIGV